MKIQELRIGNFIFNTENRIVAINGINLGIVYYGHISASVLEYCAPIPLNDCWLERLGFINNRISINYIDELCYSQYGDSWSIHYQTKGSGFTRDYGIAYVHQLQNLYYALTGGKELEARNEYNT